MESLRGKMLIFRYQLRCANVGKGLLHRHMVLNALDCSDEDITTVRRDIAAMEAGLQKLEQQERQYSTELDAALKEYAESQRVDRACKDLANHIKKAKKIVGNGCIFYRNYY